MLEQVVFTRGAWRPRHRPDLDCWCRPTLRDEGAYVLHIHRNALLALDWRQRAFISGPMKAPI